MVQITTEGKAQIYSVAIIEALATAGRGMGDPDINAALGALAHAQAYLIAKILDRNARRLAEKMAVESLGNMIAVEVNERLAREEREGDAR